MQELWSDWPERELDGLMKGYMLAQWSFWIQQIVIINIEDRRKDHWQMLSHHFVTIALISASYAYHQTRVGNLIMVLMDVVDLVFPVSQVNRMGNKNLTNNENSLLNVLNTLDLLLFATSCSAYLYFRGFSLATCFTL